MRRTRWLLAAHPGTALLGGPAVGCSCRVPCMHRAAAKESHTEDCEQVVEHRALPDTVSNNIKGRDEGRTRIRYHKINNTLTHVQHGALELRPRLQALAVLTC